MEGKKGSVQMSEEAGWPSLKKSLNRDSLVISVMCGEPGKSLVLGMSSSCSESNKC